eukprot:5050275-Karenia_brevis.AAC.1
MDDWKPKQWWNAKDEGGEKGKGKGKGRGWNSGKGKGGKWWKEDWRKGGGGTSSDAAADEWQAQW